MKRALILVFALPLFVSASNSDLVEPRVWVGTKGKLEQTLDRIERIRQRYDDEQTERHARNPYRLEAHWICDKPRPIEDFFRGFADMFMRPPRQCEHFMVQIPTDEDGRPVGAARRITK